MSQAASSTNTEPEVQRYTVTVDSPEDLAAVERYARENPGAKILVQYSSPMVIRGAKEADYGENSSLHVRDMGGATDYAGPSWAGIIQSGICFEDVQEEALSEVQQLDEYLEQRAYLDQKDAFVDEGLGRNDPKLLGFGVRMGEAGGSPNLYGISWRETELTEEERRMIEEDVTAAIPEEVEQLSFAVREETGESLRENLLPHFQEVSVKRLLEETSGDREPDVPTRTPTSCVTYWRPEEGYSARDQKRKTTLWPWDTS